MIKTPDYKIEIRFDDNLSGRPLYQVFRNGEPYILQYEDYKELGDVLAYLSYAVNRHAEELEKTALVSSLRGQVEGMNMEQANRLLSEEGKRVWVDIHNATGNCYRIGGDGKIAQVPMAGVWK